MGLAIVTVGDRTNHGGTVIGGAATTDTHGKRFARIGDMVACPRCKGVFPISQGDPSFIEEGKAVAYHGCKVACGATLIAGQGVTTTEPSGGAAADTTAGARLAQGFGDIGDGLMARYEDEALDGTGQRLRGRFQVLDLTTGAPVAGQSARLRSTGGQYLTGSTNAEGYTQWVERYADEALAFDIIEPEQA